ncbi:MAG: hypothetical protein NTW36_00165 [Planctomycetia bacterium]|nr:hypothetical protein [Planctomycetia bacterium]
MVVARLLLALGAVGCCAAGCGQRLPLVPVAGQVTMNGQPLDGAIVVFAPQPPIDGVVRVSSAVTGADGRFALQTNYSPRVTGNGALPGAFKVTISKSVVGTSLPAAEYRKHLAAHRKQMGDRTLSAAPEEANAFSVQLVPNAYTSAATTPLAAEVAADRTNEFTFAIE